MANTVNVQWSLSVVEPTTGFNLLNEQASVQVAQAGSDADSTSQLIPTTAGGTALVIPAAVNTAGWGTVRNMDLTNTIQIGVQVSGTFYPIISLPPQQSHPISWGTLTPYALAITGAATLRFSISDR